jgi:hypothetical protein
MPKFRIRLKVQGLELEVDGEREDIPAITSAVRRQITGLIVPAEIMADGHKELGDGGRASEAEDEGKSKAKARKRAPRTTGDGGAGQAIDFRHDSAKYGSPKQDWSVTEKSIWLLYVIGSITGNKEISGPQIAATFNSNFKAAGRIHPPHVSRDLGRAKVQSPAPVGEDKTLWYLTDEGERQAQELIKGVLNTA